jgi:hypothetical protein
MTDCNTFTESDTHLPRASLSADCQDLTGSFRAFALALRLRLDNFGIGGSILQPKSQQWIWMTLAVLALGAISYLAVAPAVIKQATAPAELGLKAKPEKA